MLILMKNVNIANAYKMKNAVKLMKTICANFCLEFVSKKKSKWTIKDI